MVGVNTITVFGTVTVSDVSIKKERKIKMNNHRVLKTILFSIIYLQFQIAVVNINRINSLILFYFQGSFTEWSKRSDPEQIEKSK